MQNVLNVSSTTPPPLRSSKPHNVVSLFSHHINHLFTYAEKCIILGQLLLLLPPPSSRSRGYIHGGGEWQMHSDIWITFEVPLPKANISRRRLIWHVAFSRMMQLRRAIYSFLLWGQGMSTSCPPCKQIHTQQQHQQGHARHLISAVVPPLLMSKRTWRTDPVVVV